LFGTLENMGISQNSQQTIKGINMGISQNSQQSYFNSIGLGMKG
jgi:hypothetical protein